MFFWSKLNWKIEVLKLILGNCYISYHYPPRKDDFDQSAQIIESLIAKAEKSSNFRSMTVEMTWLYSKPLVLVVRGTKSLTDY